MATKRLSELKRGESATISNLEGDDALRLRLMEMGVLKGETVRLVKHAPLGDPLELLLGGYHLSLRKREADCVLVEPTE
ncbi:MAG: FeoA family protein [Candidatus Poribacteria bacterium]|nr:FeoA family protein [Candidatus Poribacteria bacterium]